MQQAGAWISLLCLTCSLAVAAPADEVKALLEQGKDRQAYEAGKAAPEALGTPLFDFYFGIAALNGGVPGEGVLALERYLLQHPENRSAQFQLARGYFILGEDQRAREEFSSLAPAASGAELENINQFLDAIRARESRYKPTSSAFVELGAGYDTNINSGIRSGQVAGLPAGFVVLPGQSSERQADSYSSALAGIQGAYPFAPGWSLYGGAMLMARSHSHSRSDVFDQQILAVQGGLSLLEGRSLYRLGVDLLRLSVDNQKYLSLNTLVGEWQYQNDQYNRFAVSLQHSRQSYQNIDSFLDINKTLRVSSGADVRDSSLTSLTGAWTHTLAHRWNPVFTTSVNAGSERNRKNRPDLSRDLWGVRASVTAQPLARWTLGSGLSYQASRYASEFAVGIPARRDQYYALDLSAAYALDRNWSLRGEYQQVEQQSSIGFFDYSRRSVALKLRYDFK
ncbi:MAG: outer membrane beta-barrel protein [Polaromonas sp.]|uniref:outer membrane beta-barrel protein n=1 Tax=Polaromonas sp. TaxID=1869339 RepID=UPI0017D86F4A|nr:outer membrane beta-barrel protein [Polaromonas sp.]MBA3594200.1 outer membrane beta-barrel protein [Polaromonas sp.]